MNDSRTGKSLTQTKMNRIMGAPCLLKRKATEL